MTLWIALFLVLTATVAVVLRPLVVGPRNLSGGDDREVYAAQLDELEARHAPAATMPRTQRVGSAGEFSHEVPRSRHGQSQMRRSACLRPPRKMLDEFGPF